MKSIYTKNVGMKIPEQFAILQWCKLLLEPMIQKRFRHAVAGRL